MILSDISRIYYYGNGTARLLVPLHLLSMINVDTHKSHELYAYTSTPRYEEIGMPRYAQIHLSPVRLNPSITHVGLTIMNTPGTMEEVTKFLRKRRINIMKTDDTTIGTYGIAEMYLDLSHADVRADGLVSEIEECLKGDPVVVYSKPETIQERLIANPFGSPKDRIPVESSSEPGYAALLLNGDIIKSLEIDWIPPVEDESVQANVIVTTYEKFPMLSAALLDPAQKIVHVRAYIRNVCGSLDEVLLSIKDLITIYASDTTEFREGFGFWDAIGFYLASSNTELVRQALLKVEPTWIEKSSILVEELGGV